MTDEADADGAEAEKVTETELELVRCAAVRDADIGGDGGEHWWLIVMDLPFKRVIGV